MTTRTLSPPPTPAKPSSLDFRKWSPRTASLIAGIGLAGMAIVMPIGYFGGIMPLVTAGDPEATASSIAASPLPYLGGIAAILVVILLDFVVAGAWYALFKSVNRRLSAAAAWIRVAYTVLFGVAAAQLVNAFLLLDDPVRALAAIETYTAIWVASLGLFGIHLLVIAYLIIRADFIATIFGILLAIAGAAYIVDAIGIVFGLGLPIRLGTFGFVGEVAIIFWLFIKGRRLPAD
jgi:hypothetical protein